MTFKIINQEADVISKDAFRLVLIDKPSDLMIKLADYSIGGFAFWGDSVGVDFENRVPDEAIEEYLERLK